MSPLPERPPRDPGEDPGSGPRPPRRPAPGEPPACPLDLRCRRCAKRVTDLEMEVYFVETGLCFWCAYVESQG